jgi:hypothetical protein
LPDSEYDSEYDCRRRAAHAPHGNEPKAPARRGGFYHSNTFENYFSILNRGVTGNYQWVSAKHLKRYLGEFDFRYNTCHVTDFERAALAAKGIQGKRLTYRRTNTGAAC